MTRVAAAPVPTPAGAAARTRVVEWEDPIATLRDHAGLSGLEYIQGILAGEIPPPPIALLLGFQPVEVAVGRVVFAMEPGEHLYNPIGTVHGGAAATLIDTVTGVALHTTLPAGASYTTTDLKVTFTRPILLDTGRVLAEGTVVHRGRKLATAEARVTAEDTGKLLAHGSATLLLI